MARKGQNSDVRRTKAFRVKAGMTMLGHAGRELHVKAVQPHGNDRSRSIFTRELGGMHFSDKTPVRVLR